jgi:polysaccharide export outer membrane protein
MDPGQVMLASGDVVSVLSRDQSKVFISGEVIVPRSLQMHNGRLSLNEALGEAGGINPASGDAGQVYVIRRSANEPVVYRLDAHSPNAMALAEGFELYPKDVVYVAPTALTNWARTITQILPGAVNSVVNTAVAPR